MKKALDFLVILLAVMALGLSGCGDATDSGSGDSSNDNSNNSNNSRSSGGDNNGSSTVTCDELCSHYLAICPDDVTMETCQQGCPSISNTMRSCIMSKSTCSETFACDEGGGGNNSGDNSCGDHALCDTGFCYRQTADQAFGECAEQDIGTPCRRDSDCMYSFCWKDGLNIDGTCSVACSSDDQCPSGTECLTDDEHDAKGCKAK